MANKKINQLVAKTTIQSTDLFPIGDATTGTLYKKTIADLQAAIGGAVISVNGLVGTVVLDADDILETATPTNRYFTDARARAAISLTTTGSSGASSYSSSTGVLNVPTYTLAGLGGITATFLSGGTGITYNSGTGVISYSGTVYTDSSIRGLVSAGTGLSYNSSTGVFTNSITQYTDALARAAISATSPITYNSTTGVIGITGANLTESTSSVLTITGGTGALLSAASIQVKQASGSQSGFLSSTDWTTFNNKQNALTNPVTGTGTTNYLPKWTSTSGLGDSVIQENSGSIGINGAAVPDAGDTRLQINATTFATLNLKSTSVNANIRSHNTNGGFYLGTISNHFVSIFTNDTVRMTITNAGNVGIGTSSASSRLTVDVGNVTGAGQWASSSIALTNPTNIGAYSQISFGYTPGTTNASAYLGFLSTNQGSNGYGDLVFGTRAVNTDTQPTERMRITSGGNVGIGTSSPTIYGGGMEISRATQAGLRVSSTGGTSPGGIEIGFESSIGGFIQTVTTGGQITFYTGNAATTVARFTSGGNVLIGTTTDNGERLYVSGSIRATGTITANSDITLKKNLAKIENALEKVEQINGYTYEFKADDSKRHAGVIAQEIQGVLPEIVNKGNDGLLGVEYGNISALLIEAIKDLKSKNELLEARLVALEK